MKRKYFLVIATLFFATKSYSQFSLNLLDTIQYPGHTASLWGYAAGGQEYCLLGTYYGMSVIDVTNPANCLRLFTVPTDSSNWHEIKTFGNYAYCTNEAGGGLLVVDLTNLPGAVTHSYFTDGGNLDTQHTLYIDENGILYIFGSNEYQNGGVVLFDLNVSPTNPPQIGHWDTRYIHDGFVRGDTLWASEVYDGNLELLNVSNPSNITSMAIQQTPLAFTHNSWPTSDNHYVFTTDEKPNSSLTSYDISNFSNIIKLDEAKSNPGSDVIIHNVHLHDDNFAVVSYYRDGVTIWDVSHPDNIIETENYDTSPLTGNGFNGDWGVYPYLPSGNILVSDIERGLLVFAPAQYIHACWLNGNVTDTLTNAPLNGVSVVVNSTTNSATSDLNGDYKTGNGSPGTYSVTFTKYGYFPKTINNVILTTNVTTILNAELYPLTALTQTGNVVDSVSSTPIANAKVAITDNGIYNWLSTCDVSGNFNQSIFVGTYDVGAGIWGHVEKFLPNQNLSGSSITIPLAKGYYDDYYFNNSWTVSGNAATGMWQRGEPLGTYAGTTPIQPDNDVANDYGVNCFVTGNNGTSSSDDDVDQGTTNLTSPQMDLTGYFIPRISFYWWFANAGGASTPNDTLRVTVTNGTTSATLLTVNSSSANMFQWNYFQADLTPVIANSNNMHVVFHTADTSPGHIVEAAIDKFYVWDGAAVGVNNLTDEKKIGFSISPVPFNEVAVGNIFGNYSAADNFVLKTYNLLGSLVEQQIITSKNNFSFGKNLTDGIYIVQLSVNGNNFQTQKVVKMK